MSERFKFCNYCGVDPKGNNSGMCDDHDRHMNGRITGRPVAAPPVNPKRSFADMSALIGIETALMLGY